MKIYGNAAGSVTPRADYAQTDPSQPDFIRNKPDRDIQDAKNTANAALPKSGGAMTGPIAMGGNRVTGLGAPADAADAVNKAYVDGKKKAVTVTLTVSGWESGAQTANVDGVTAGNTILVGYSPDSFEAYTDAGIRCTGQGEGTLAFVCESAPDADVNVNVVILN